MDFDRRSNPVAGEEGRYFLRFIPIITEPTKMIYRSNAFQFNNRFGDNTRLTDPGLVIWKENSLLGINPDGIETRWAHLDEIEREGIRIEIFILWRNIGITKAKPDDLLNFNLDIRLPGTGRVNWAGPTENLNAGKLNCFHLIRILTVINI